MCMEIRLDEETRECVECEEMEQERECEYECGELE